MSSLGEDIFPKLESTSQVTQVINKDNHMSLKPPQFNLLFLHPKFIPASSSLFLGLTIVSPFFLSTLAAMVYTMFFHSYYSSLAILTLTPFLAIIISPVINLYAKMPIRWPKESITQKVKNPLILSNPFIF